MVFGQTLISCNDNEKKPQPIKVGDKVFKPSLLTKYDSAIIKKANESIVRIDSFSTDKFNCNRNIKYYDKLNNLKIEEFREAYLSDMRQVWSNKLFFGDNKDTLLVLSFDGLNNVVNVER